jgi:transcriptional regulator with XRE-family HTH domain
LSAAEAKGSVRLGAYLRRLRDGYGYTLRRVEERAQGLGDSIDNSQLSRFEKGKALPSFDKLRTLARIFNVPVQQFSDILDLEGFDRHKPTTDDYDFLLEEGHREFKQGRFGRSYVIYERALEVCEAEDAVQGNGAAALERQASARLYMAYALKALGRLSMAEHELRSALRSRRKLPRRVQLRAMTLLSHAYREQGDYYLASVMAREALEVASAEGDLSVQVAILNTLGNISFDEGYPRQAAEHYERALSLAERVDDLEEMRAMFCVNLGGCLSALGKHASGAARIRQGLALAREKGYRRPLALGLSRLAETHLSQGEKGRALSCLKQSDEVAAGHDEPYNDILFLNAYLRWDLARAEGNAVLQRVALGRLKAFRSLIERKFPEVVAFDAYIEGRRSP